MHQFSKLNDGGSNPLGHTTLMMNKMSTIKFDGVTITYEESCRSYSCYVKEHDIYFGASVEKGVPEIIRKAKAMIQSKENFLLEFPQYKK